MDCCRAPILTWRSSVRGASIHIGPVTAILHSPSLISPLLPSFLSPKNPNPGFNHRLFLNKRRRLRISSSLPDAAEGAKVEYTPWLVVGLGNPGNKYHGTRHNVGFEMVDRTSRDEGISLNTIQSKALIGVGSIGEVPILLAKLQDYMNFSGESVDSMLEQGMEAVRTLVRKGFNQSICRFNLTQK